MIKINILEYINSIRGIAIILVLIVHLSLLIPVLDINLPQNILKLISLGKYGVILFFIVSSYTLFRSLNLRKEKKIIYFFLRRFFRIAPLYYLIIIILFFTTNGISYYLDSNISQITLNNLLLHIFFLNGFFSNSFNSIIGVEWTIFVEVWFYLFLPFIFLYKKHINKILIFMLFISLITFIYLKFYSIIGLSKIAIYKSPLIQFLAFLPGCYIYLYEKNKKINTFFIKYNKIILFLIGLSFIGLSYYTPPLQFIIMIIIFVLFFLVIKNNNIKLFNNKLLQYIGKISYSLYLIHFIILSFIINNGEHFFLNTFNPIYTFIFFILTTFLISTITYNLIEVNFIKLGKKFINKIKND